MNKSIIIVGGFHEIIELCEEASFSIIGLIDSKLKNEYFGYPILGNDSDALEIKEKFPNCNLVISPDLPKIRKRIVQYYSEIGFDFETIVSPFAKVSKTAKIGKGSIIQGGVNISALSEVGDFVKLNVNCNVMHDSIIGSFSTLAPNSVILGRVKIGENSYLGANSTILPEINIGNDVTIGAGAVVTKNIESNRTVKGIPAK